MITRNLYSNNYKTLINSYQNRFMYMPKQDEGVSFFETQCIAHYLTFYADGIYCGKRRASARRLSVSLSVPSWADCACSTDTAALAAVRRSSMRSASVLSEPCELDTLVYLACGSFYTSLMFIYYYVGLCCHGRPTLIGDCCMAHSYSTLKSVTYLVSALSHNIRRHFNGFYM